MALIDERNRLASAPATFQGFNRGGTPATFERVQPPQRSLISRLQAQTNAASPAELGQPEPSGAPGAAWPAVKNALLYNSDAAAKASANPLAKPPAPAKPVSSMSAAMRGGSADKQAGNLTQPIQGGGLIGRMVSNTSVPGVKRVDGGSSPLYTNIDPATAADQISGMKPGQVQMGDGVDMAGGNARMALANSIRGEGIAGQASGAKGGVIGGGDNGSAEFFDRAGTDFAMRWGKTMGGAPVTRSMREALVDQQKLGLTARGQDLDAQQAAAEQGIARERLAGEQGVSLANLAMRQQELAAESGVRGVQAQSAQYDLAQKQAIGNLRAQLATASPEQRAGIIQRLADLQGAQGVVGKDRYITVKSGQTTDAQGMVTAAPDRVFDTQTQQFVNLAGGQQDGGSPYPEGTRLIGPDGKRHVVKNGVPVPEGK